MDVNKPEVLQRGMYDASIDRPEITQENDINGDFTSKSVISDDLLAIVHQAPSVDPEVAVREKTHAELAVDAEKVAEENPQSRFRILDIPIKKPGVCALCGDAGGDGRQFVDFGKTVEWYGVVYFCTACVTEAAKLIGLDAKSSDYNLAMANLQTEISNGDDRYVETKVKLDAAMVLLRNCHCSDPVTDVPAVEVPEAELIESDSSVDNGESTDGNESDSDESAVVEGPDDIPADSGDDEFTASGRRRRTRKSDG